MYWRFASDRLASALLDTPVILLAGEVAGDRFIRGPILYGGNETLPFGPKLFAVPLAALWTEPT